MSRIDDLAGVLFVKFQQDFPLTEGRGTAKTIKNTSTKTVESGFISSTKRRVKSEKCIVCG